jgi:hypothetical protein
MTTINPETKQVADEFMTRMDTLFEIMDTAVMEGRPFTDGEYLAQCNDMKKMREMVQQMSGIITRLSQQAPVARQAVAETVIFRTAQRQHTARVREPKKSKALGLEDPKNMKCPKCERIMTIRHYKENHSKAGICGQLQQSVKNGASKVSKLKRHITLAMNDLLFKTARDSNDEIHSRGTSIHDYYNVTDRPAEEGWRRTAVDGRYDLIHGVGSLAAKIQEMSRPWNGYKCPLGLTTGNTKRRIIIKKPAKKVKLIITDEAGPAPTDA